MTQNQNLTEETHKKQSNSAFIAVLHQTAFENGEYRQIFMSPGLVDSP